MQPTPDSTVAAVGAPPERADEMFLEGPRSRIAEFCTDPHRVFGGAFEAQTTLFKTSDSITPRVKAPLTE